MEHVFGFLQMLTNSKSQLIRFQTVNVYVCVCVCFSQQRKCFVVSAAYTFYLFEVLAVRKQVVRMCTTNQSSGGVFGVKRTNAPRACARTQVFSRTRNKR